MPLGICENGHKFNRDRHGDTCPVCGVVTRKYKEEGKAREELEAMYKLPKNKYVCGWLVCIEGVNKGRSYGICSGKNFIGSGDDMDIQILGDGKVEKHRHAAVAFDEKTHIATLLPGESATLVYLDDTAMYKSKAITTFNEIEIGTSKFKYVPFCNSENVW